MATNTPLVLDANVIKDIARGHRQAATALRRHLKSGRAIYISRAAYNQLVTPAASDSPYLRLLRVHYRELIKDAGIRIGPLGSRALRVDVYATTPPRGQPGTMQDYRVGKPGDMFVAAEAKGLNAELWTHDRRLARNAARLGVRTAPECNLGGKSGIEFPHRARAWLGLRRINVSPQGNVVNRSGGVVFRTPPTAAGRLGAVRSMGGRIRAGLRGVRGSLILIGLVLIFAYIQSKLDQWIIEKQMKELEPTIRSLLMAKAFRVAQVEARGCVAFANITVTITIHYTLDPETGYEASAPWVERDVKVDISDKVVEAKGSAVRYPCSPGYYEKTPFTYSVALSGPDGIGRELGVCKPPDIAALESDTEIRDWVKRTAPLIVKAIPTLEKIRLINRLLDGWISDADVMGIEKICANVANREERSAIQRAIRPRETSISDHGQRIRVRAALQGR